MIPGTRFLANPARFMEVSRWLAPTLGGLAAALFALGLWLGMGVPDDYQQGATVRIMFVHLPAAFMSMIVYALLGVASFLGLVPISVTHAPLAGPTRNG